MKASLTFFILYFFSVPVSAQQFKRIFLFNDFVQAQVNFVIILFQPFRLTMMLQTKQCFFAKEGK